MATTTSIYIGDGTGGGIPQLQSLNTAWAHQTAIYYPKLFPLLATGQTPQILWIGCSDSRVPETALLGLLPGEVFVHRNIANAVNPDDLSLPAALEYAVEHVKVKHIIVCGHIGCGGIAGTCSAALVGIPAVDRWIAPLRALLNSRASQMAGKSSADEQTAMVKINVQNSVAKISADTYVVAAIAAGTLQVHGTIYDVGSGLLNFLAPADLAMTAIDAPYASFNNTWWFSINNAVIGGQCFVDIQSYIVQCNGTSGTYPNQHWKFPGSANGSFFMVPSGMGGQVATVDMTTLLISTKPQSTGDASIQNFRPTTPDGGGTWYFTCDALPPAYQLGYDAASSTLKMSTTAGAGAAWKFNALGKL